MMYEVRDGDYKNIPLKKTELAERSKVVVVVDCDEWKLKYYLDDELIFDPNELKNN